MNDLLDENKLTLQRREKLKAIREQEGIAFPNDFRRNALAQDLLNQYEALESEELEAKALRVSLGGRLMTKRVKGRASFAHLHDMSGRLQVFLHRDSLTEGVYEAF